MPAAFSTLGSFEECEVRAEESAEGAVSRGVRNCFSVVSYQKLLFRGQLLMPCPPLWHKETPSSEVEIARAV